MRPALIRSARRGSVKISALLLLPVLFLAFVLALFAAEASRARTAQQNNADASALAVAGALLDDAGLLDDPKVLAALRLSALEQGRQVARDNHILGEGVTLRDRQGDDPGDVLMLARSPKGELEPLDLRGKKIIDLPQVEAVRLAAHRTSERGTPLRLIRGPWFNRVPMDLIVRATVLIERDVIGIRPLPGIAAPLAPLALLSDPSGKNKRAWEPQVELKRGSDEWAMDRSKDRPRVVEDKDGLHEMEVHPTGEDANACVLQLGVKDLDGVAKQLIEGVRQEDLELLDGELVLGKSGEVLVPGTRVSHKGLTSLAIALTILRDRGEALVWPLYRRIHDKSGMPLISGFVVARVVAFGEKDGRFVFVLQPAQRAVSAAVTASSLERLAEKNRYLGRLRLAE